jgi:hypothetical protein
MDTHPYPTTWRHDNELHDTQHNDTQKTQLAYLRQRYPGYMTLSFERHSAESIAFGIVLLSVIMTNVVMLSVVAPASKLKVFLIISFEQRNRGRENFSFFEFTQYTSTSFG